MQWGQRSSPSGLEATPVANEQTAKAEQDPDSSARLFTEQSIIQEKLICPICIDAIGAGNRLQSD